MRIGPARTLLARGAAATIFIAAAILPACTSALQPSGGQADRIGLDRGWWLRSSAQTHADGHALSRPGVDMTDWLPVTVPSTVLAALEANGLYPHLLHGTNLKGVPRSDFDVPWWFRTEFALSDEQARAFPQLHLDGINYRADVWLNGRRIATSAQVVGTYRAFGLDVGGILRAGANAIAVRVHPVDPNRDLTITWIDWNPMPPDRGMGIWRDAYLTTSGPVALSEPQVTSRLALPGLDEADLTVTAEVTNRTDSALTAAVAGVIGSVRVSTSVELGPGGSTVVTFEPATFPQLHLARPRVWWPYQMGSQDLYTLDVTVRVDGVVSDRASTGFGIRDVSSRLMNGHRVFSVNGRRILVRGGGWAPDMLLRRQRSRTLDELRYVRDLGLNMIRLEGKLPGAWFYEMTDRLGILVLPGWMCCDVWQRSAGWDEEDRRVAEGSMYSQAVELRNHPSVMAFLIGSDTNPPPDVEDLYLRALGRANWPDPILASASGDSTATLGPTGVKMAGPYEWIPPAYWYSPRAPGGADGFNTETSAGASIPELENLPRMLERDELRALWSDPSAPQYHAGVRRSRFADFRIFDAAMAERLGAPSSLDDYVEKAQLLNYEAERAMFEAFSRERYRATGVIQWMMQNAWPSLHWNLFDWYLSPNGSYFGAKEANEPLHIQYSYDDRSIVVVNGTEDDATDLRALVRVFDLDGTRRLRWSGHVAVGADDVERVFRLPQIRGLSSTYFVALELRDGRRAVSSNVYWLSTSPEKLAWSRTRWFYTPTRRFADLSALSTLPTVRPAVTACSVMGGRAGSVHVTIANRSSAVAFFLRTRLTRGVGGPDLLPVRWTDDYVTLMPGDRTRLTARFRTDDLRGSEPALTLSGWNVPERSVTELAACG